MARSPAANVMPVFFVDLALVNARMLYSTGSSSVMRFVSSFASSCSMAHIVVDLPEPVGPTIKITPLLFF